MDRSAGMCDCATTQYVLAHAGIGMSMRQSTFSGCFEVGKWDRLDPRSFAGVRACGRKHMHIARHPCIISHTFVSCTSFLDLRDTSKD